MNKHHTVLGIAFVAILLLGAVPDIWAQTLGSDCRHAIPLGNDYQAKITEPQTLWYTAWTFDLPLAVDYYPDDENQEAPVVALDFGCTPGTYHDSILCSIFCSSNPGYIVLPYTETLSPSKDAEGRTRYHAEMGTFYRDMLLRQGIAYNVEVFVMVTFNGTGNIGMSPDPFSTCMDGPKFMHLGDTVKVKAKDAERHVIVPYVQWQNYDIRYIWEGEERVTLAVMGKRCDFDPLDNSDENMLQFKRLQPGDTLKMTSGDIQRYLNDATKQKDGGMYFAKFYSEGKGVMKVERVPAASVGGDATVLEYDKEVSVEANSVEKLYAIPKSWTQATLFTTPTDHVFKMYIGLTPSFTPDEAIASYQFDKVADGHQLGLQEQQMTALWAETEDKYLYVRFECSQSTTLLPTLWSPSPCLAKSTLIKPEETVNIAARSKTDYRLLYADWKGGEMVINWEGQSGDCPFYLGDSCIQKPFEDNPHVFFDGNIAENSTFQFSTEDVNEWASYVDPDGYLYARFYPNNKGTITLTTTAPGEKDPVYPRASIYIQCLPDNKGFKIRVREAMALQIIDSDGNEVWQHDVTPEQAAEVELDSGNYTLIATKQTGEQETVKIIMP